MVYPLKSWLQMKEILYVMYKYFGTTRDYLSENSSEDEELEANINWIAFKHKFFSSILVSEEGLEKSTGHQLLEDDNYTDSYYSRSSIPSMGEVSLKISLFLMIMIC